MNTIVSIVAKALVAGLTLALIAAPLAAQAADADVGIAITRLRSSALGSNDPDADKITIGQTKTLTLTLTNNGPSSATGVAVNKPTLDSKLTIVEVRGCALKAVGGVIDPTLDAAWPCTVGAISDLAPGNTATVSVDVKYTDKTADLAAIPADFPKHLPATCPADDTLTGNQGFALDPVAVSILSTTTDLVAANDSASQTFLTAGMADVQVEITQPATGPGSFAFGQDSEFTIAVTNLGPCVAADVWTSDWDGSSAFVPPPPFSPDGTPTLGTWVFVGSTGDAGTDCETIWDGCGFGDIPAGTTLTQVAVYAPQPMPDNDLMQTAYPFSVNVYSAYYPYDAGVAAGQTLDPILGNNKKTLKHIVTKDVSSCSTGGVPGALGLLLVGMAALRRRRS